MKTSHEVMEYIWDKMKKNKDGTITFKDADVAYLYIHGFVDTKKHSLENWQQAFESFKDKDGDFSLSKERFLSLAPFRYNGPVGKIFDASKIREGSWSDEELKLLFEKSISKVSRINEKIFWTYIKKHKKSGSKDKKGNFIMDRNAKSALREFVEQFPSAQRLLEKKILEVSYNKK